MTPFEHRGQLAGAEQILDLLPRIGYFKIAIGSSPVHIGADQGAEPGTVDIADIRQVQDEALAPRDQFPKSFLEHHEVSELILPAARSVV